jgi:hypothetical protein
VELLFFAKYLFIAARAVSHRLVSMSLVVLALSLAAFDPGTDIGGPFFL